MSRRSSDRGDRSTLVVYLGETEIRVKAPSDPQTAKLLQKGLMVMRKSSVDEEEAKLVMDAFETALAPPIDYKAAHLCMAEVYLSGSAPQIGKDYRRAVTELVAYLEAGRDSDQADSPPYLDVARETADIAHYLDSSTLAPLQQQLIRLAREVPLLQGAALRASLARLDRIDGSAHQCALAITGAPIAQAGPMDFLDVLLRELSVFKREHTLLKEESRDHRSQTALLQEALEDARDRRDAAEELVCRFSNSAEQIHNANERLVERMEAEILRVDQAERSKEIAEADAEELRKEVQRLRSELELERRGANSAALKSERDRFGGQRGTSPSMTLGSARKTAVATQQILPSRPGTRTGSLTARGESPAPAPAEPPRQARDASPQVQQGYESRRCSSPTGRDRFSATANAKREVLDNLLSARGPSPSPQERLVQLQQENQAPDEYERYERDKLGLRDMNGRVRSRAKLGSQTARGGGAESPGPVRERANFTSAGRRLITASPSAGNENMCIN